jgi:fructosamine-3-kinase
MNVEQRIIEEVSQHLNGVVTEIRRIDRGEVNQSYFLKTSLSKYVFRLDPNETNLTRFNKETWAMTKIAQLGVLVPKVIATGKLEQHPYMIMEYIEGKDGDKTTPEQQLMIWKTLGKYARQTHSMEVAGYGEGMTAPGVFSGSWEALLDYNLSALNTDDKLLKLGIISSNQSDLIKSIFYKLKKVTLKFGFIHNDLKLENTVLVNDSDLFLLDWGSAEVAVIPHLEIATILEDSLDEKSDSFLSFLAGYGLSVSDFEVIKPEIHMIKLLVRVDKVRWALDKRPDRLNSLSKDLKGHMLLMGLN